MERTDFFFGGGEMGERFYIWGLGKLLLGFRSDPSRSLGGPRQKKR